jgi:hypothetical protein
MEVSGQLHAPPLYPRGNSPPLPIGQEAEWAPEPVRKLWRREESCTTGNRTRAVQPATHRYIVGASPTPLGVMEKNIVLALPRDEAPTPRSSSSQPSRYTDRAIPQTCVTKAQVAIYVERICPNGE